MADDFHFGVGCLSFEIIDFKEGMEDGWSDMVRKALHSMPTVSEVSVDVDRAELLVPDDEEDPIWSNTSGNFDNYRLVFAPHPQWGEIAFSVRIPTRLQNEFRPGISEHLNTEEFRVITRYGYHGPVTYVVCSGAHGRADGSAAVGLVHDFISKEIKSDYPLRWRRVGPSPFHADFALRRDESSPDFSCQISPRRGYDRYDFTYQSDSHDSRLEALDSLLGRLAPELQLFYLLVIQRNRRGLRASAVATEGQQLIEFHRATGLLATAKRVLTGGRLARHLALNVMSAEFDSQDENRLAKDAIYRVYQSFPDGPFRPILESEAADKHSDQLKSTRDLIALLEGGRSKEFEVSIVAAATLFGAAGGALASIISG